MRRGDIYWTEFSPTVGSEQYGLRPALIIQNDIGNKYANTVIVAVITKREKKKLPTHVYINKKSYNLEYDSVITLEQIRTVDKWRVKGKISSLSPEKIKEVNLKLMESIGTDYVKVRSVSDGKLYKIQRKHIYKLKS
jgi:mRNA interferase MazF